MAQGFFGVIVIAGPAIGPTLGGYLTTNVNWRWIFFINIPFAIAATFMCLAFLPADEENDPSKVSAIDWTGIALLTLGLGSLQTVLEEGRTDDWFDSRFIHADHWSHFASPPRGARAPYPRPFRPRDRGKGRSRTSHAPSPRSLGGKAGMAGRRAKGPWSPFKFATATATPIPIPVSS